MLSFAANLIKTFARIQNIFVIQSNQLTKYLRLFEFATQFEPLHMLFRPPDHNVTSKVYGKFVAAMRNHHSDVRFVSGKVENSQPRICQTKTYMTPFRRPLEGIYFLRCRRDQKGFLLIRLENFNIASSSGGYCGSISADRDEDLGNSSKAFNLS